MYTIDDYRILLVLFRGASRVLEMYFWYRVASPGRESERVRASPLSPSRRLPSPPPLRQVRGKRRQSEKRRVRLFLSRNTAVLFARDAVREYSSRVINIVVSKREQPRVHGALAVIYFYTCSRCHRKVTETRIACNPTYVKWST